jgi:kinesin family protein 1
MDVAFEVHSRNSGNPGWLAMFTPVKPISTATYGLFELVLTPAARRGRRNLWKRSSAQVYIRGEEVLGGWNPRGLSLVEDYHAFEKNLADEVDLEISRCLAKENFEPQDGSEEEYQKLLQYCIDLWKTPSRNLKAHVYIFLRLNLYQVIQRKEISDAQSTEAETPEENITMEYDVKFIPRM